MGACGEARKPFLWCTAVSVQLQGPKSEQQQDCVIRADADPGVKLRKASAFSEQAFARDQMDHFRIGFKQPPQTEARVALEIAEKEAVLANCHVMCAPTSKPRMAQQRGQRPAAP